MMENQPLLSGQSNYGFGNPGYSAVPAAGAPGMFAPPAPDPSAPSAPPANLFDNVPGYEGTMIGGGGYLPPPVPSMPMPTPESGHTHPEWNIPSISEETAKEAFAMFASSKCCYSSGPARQGVITRMDAFNTYRYRLETFCESRSTEWSQEPYNGQPVDAFIQAVPGPWDIPAQPPGFFKDHKQVIKVPYTSSVKNCYTCLGMGRSPCKDCTGAGNKVCWVCNGSGYRHGDDRCSHCNGRGRENCMHCSGQGSRDCQTCHGRRQILVFINLTINWKNNQDVYVVEQASGLKVENLSHVSGKEMFKDSQYLVFPVMGFPDRAVVGASERLVREHQANYSQTSRILQQRQTIELIPITKVSYSWKGKSCVYYVFGNEFKVSADDYPAKCCCTIL